MIRLTRQGWLSDHPEKDDKAGHKADGKKGKVGQRFIRRNGRLGPRQRLPKWMASGLTREDMFVVHDVNVNALFTTG